MNFSIHEVVICIYFVFRIIVFFSSAARRSNSTQQRALLCCFTFFWNIFLEKVWKLAFTIYKKNIFLLSWCVFCLKTNLNCHKIFKMESERERENLILYDDERHNFLITFFENNFITWSSSSRDNKFQWFSCIFFVFYRIWWNKRALQSLWWQSLWLSLWRSFLWGL